MEKLQNKRVAIVCDWLIDYGGAEMVLKDLLEIFPEADIYTSVCFMKHPMLEKRRVYTSFIQHIPFLRKKHKLTLTLRPRAFESFDFSGYDIVISSTTAEAKGIITKPTTLHISYCHTPTRYFWSHYHEYLTYMEFGILNPLAKRLMPRMVHHLRQWDFLASKRVDYFIANSKNTASRIKKYYKQNAQVIYPSIDIENLPFQEKKGDYYFYNGRCIPYKKFDLIVKTFNQNGKPIILHTNTKNKLYRKLKASSKPNITWKEDISFEELNTLLAGAKAFIFPPEEDFGIAPLIAMATGTPVIAYGKGGALETVVDEKTGIFFDSQTPSSLNEAIERFETLAFHPQDIKKHAAQFDKHIFQKQILAFIESLI